MIKIHLTIEELKEALDFAEFHDYNVITIRYGEDKMKERYVSMSEFNSDKREVCITDLEYRV